MQNARRSIMILNLPISHIDIIIYWCDRCNVLTRIILGCLYVDFFFKISNEASDHRPKLELHIDASDKENDTPDLFMDHTFSYETYGVSFILYDIQFLHFTSVIFLLQCSLYDALEKQLSVLAILFRYVFPPCFVINL